MGIGLLDKIPQETFPTNISYITYLCTGERGYSPLALCSLFFAKYFYARASNCTQFYPRFSIFVFFNDSITRDCLLRGANLHYRLPSSLWRHRRALFAYRTSLSLSLDSPSEYLPSSLPQCGLRGDLAAEPDDPTARLFFPREPAAPGGQTKTGGEAAGLLKACILVVLMTA